MIYILHDVACRIANMSNTIIVLSYSYYKLEVVFDYLVCIESSNEQCDSGASVRADDKVYVLI